MLQMRFIARQGKLMEMLLQDGIGFFFLDNEEPSCWRRRGTDSGININNLSSSPRRSTLAQIAFDK